MFPGGKASQRRVGNILIYLNISAACNFRKVFLLLQGLVHLVICHAETAQTGLYGIQSLCKYDKLGHIWNTDDLSVQLRGKADGVLNLPAVNQPESLGNKEDYNISCLRTYIIVWSGDQEQFTLLTHLW